MILWCVLRALNLKERDNERIDKALKNKEDSLNMSGIGYPVSLKAIDRFEKQNPGFAINVFGYDCKDRIYPPRISKVSDDRCIDLLLITLQTEQSVESHYCLLKNFPRLTTVNTGNFSVSVCINHFVPKESLEKHIE